MLSVEDRIVLLSAANGEAVEATATRVGYSVAWVRARRSELIRRLGVSNWTEAVARAIVDGLTEDDREAVRLGD